MRTPHNITLLFIFSTFISSLYSFTVTLPSQTTECYYELLNVGDRLAVSYEVDGPEQSVNFKVKNPQSQVIYQADRKTEGEYGVEATEAGHYEYCFTNDDVYLSNKRVMWNVHDITKIEKLMGADLSSEGDFGISYPDVVHLALAPLEEELNRLIQGVNFIKDQQLYMKSREATHRNTAESTNNRAKWWSIIQSGLLVIVCIFQILYLRRLFEVKHKHGI
ncbi:p24 complex component [Basidiobolus ranarum]|uniref:P24 complex component n=1 Tax=Basidiobolus ranarum TaxID=34480 RepID=A0ABR2WMF3_9FUNG